MALLQLADHLAELDAMPWRQRLETAATNLLAGNVFDWGAKEAAALMQTSGFGFQQALAHLQSKNWLIRGHYSGGCRLLAFDYSSLLLIFFPTVCSRTAVVRRSRRGLARPIEGRRPSMRRHLCRQQWPGCHHWRFTLRSRTVEARN